MPEEIKNLRDYLIGNESPVGVEFTDGEGGSYTFRDLLVEEEELVIKAEFPVLFERVEARQLPLLHHLYDGTYCVPSSPSRTDEGSEGEQRNRYDQIQSEFREQHGPFFHKIDHHWTGKTGEAR